MDTEAILGAVRAVLFDGAGRARTIAPGRFTDGDYADRDPDERAALAQLRPLVDVALVAVDASDATPSAPGDYSLHEVQVRVVLTRALDDAVKVNADLLHRERAAMQRDLFDVQNALGFPGNITAGDIVSGLMLLNGPAAIDEEVLDDDGAPLLRGVLDVRGWARVSY